MKVLLASLLLSVLLAGCGPLLPRSPAPELHDLGSQRAARPLARVPVLTDVRAPNWLDGTAIHYRLAYESETRRRSYALSRWAAPPAELLSVALRRMLDSPGAPSTCRLVVELDEFIQVFEQPQASAALISGVATLVGANGRTIVDRMRFSLTEKATGADAPSGVAALSRGVDALGVRIADWLDRAEAEGLSRRCES
ncbi:MAG: ABC-type transport auxiliary lipoprotein family protein [Methyloversatilis sp.]|jgi:cholesterol transport system auxiliary component|nr:ABC-type transport auxiliary lipoprotein family protein [Methyloversatilis sp.]